MRCPPRNYKNRFSFQSTEPLNSESKTCDADADADADFGADADVDADAGSRTKVSSMLVTNADGYRGYSKVKISLATAHDFFTANPDEYPFYQIGSTGKIAFTFVWKGI